MKCRGARYRIHKKTVNERLVNVVTERHSPYIFYTLSALVRKEWVKDTY